MVDKMTFHIDDLHRAYLQVQKGKLHRFIEEGPEVWDRAYNDSMNRAFETIEPHLPEKCDHVIDVGSGLGGINALINRHYGGEITVSLIDGVNDKPEVIRHNRTFNDMNVARDFLFKNGVTSWSYFSPEEARELTLDRYPTVDLIVSFGAWNFHFPPHLYSDFIKCCSRKGTVIITDVRKNKPEWMDSLEATFGPYEVIRESEKFNKVKFVCP